MIKNSLLSIFFIVIGGCSSPNFEYPDEPEKQSYFLRTLIYKNVKYSKAFTISPSMSLETEFTEYEEIHYLQIKSKDTLVVDTTFTNYFSFQNDTEDYDTSSLEVMVDSKKIKLDFPYILHLKRDRDTFYINETDDDVQILIPLKDYEIERLDKLCFYKQPAGVFSIFQQNEMNPFDPSQYRLLSDCLFQDSLLVFPHDIQSVGTLTPNRWIKASKAEKIAEINRVKKIFLAYYSLRSFEHFRQREPVIAASGNPLRIPASIEATDSKGIFYTEYVDRFLLKVK